MDVGTGDLHWGGWTDIMEFHRVVLDFSWDLVILYCLCRRAVHN